MGRIRRNRTARMPDAQSTMSMAPREKKALWTTTKNCTRKQSQNTMQVQGGVSVMLLFIWLGCTRETRSSHSYSASTAVHPALAAIAARAGFRGTALVLVQEPVHPVDVDKTFGSSSVTSKCPRLSKTTQQSRNNKHALKCKQIHR